MDIAALMKYELIAELNKRDCCRKYLNDSDKKGIRVLYLPMHMMTMNRAEAEQELRFLMWLKDEEEETTDAIVIHRLRDNRFGFRSGIDVHYLGTQEREDVR